MVVFNLPEKKKWLMILHFPCKSIITSTSIHIASLSSEKIEWVNEWVQNGEALKFVWPKLSNLTVVMTNSLLCDYRETANHSARCYYMKNFAAFIWNS